MKLFETSGGFTISFGFDVVSRVKNKNIICWNDPTTGEWLIKPDNQAGYVSLPFDVAPEFLFEAGGRIVAYQPGRCIELQYLGPPIVWGVNNVLGDIARPQAA